MPREPLKIYHASAGTGKTFTLVKSYLTLLLGDEQVFRHILAMTFTNKATAEMKDRILHVLYGLSQTGLPVHEKEREVKEARLYLQEIPSLVSLPSMTVRKKARKALQMILYEYPAFSVQTIDSFFQRVLRGFARELDLPFAYEMEFDDKRVLGEVVDRLLLQAGEEEELLKWLTQMIEEAGDESGKWDIKELLLQQGKDIFTEEFKSLSKDVLEKLTDRSFLRRYMSDLKEVMDTFEKKMEELGRRGLQIFQENGVDENDFSNKKNGIAGIFKSFAEGTKIKNGEKIFTDTKVKALGDETLWLTKDKRKDLRLAHLVASQLAPLAREIQQYYQDHASAYYAARLIRERLHMLGIMADLRQQLYRWMQVENRLLISETGSFLRGIIGSNEIPFIYEKTGQYYSHYMIDEFQDTSRIQYENLLPLIRNSMAAGGESLIVGDIKQSLYRWRNGDWRIMYRDIYGDLHLDPGVKKRLNVNFRSLEKIVHFNNSFFVTAGEELWKIYRKGISKYIKENDPAFNKQREVLATIYAEEEVVQQVPDKAEGGYVSVRFMQEDEGSSLERALEETASLIDRLLLQEGWSPGDILILVRSNKDGREVVRYLLERQQNRTEAAMYPLISQDSLYLAASLGVRFIISFLKYLTDPDDLVNFATLWALYDRLQGNSSLPSFHQQDMASLSPEKRVFLFLPDGEAPWLDQLMLRPLPEVVQEIILHFALQDRREDVPFLYALQNFLGDLVHRNSMDVTDFLEWWDDTGWEKSLQLPEEVDAVRVMTIHKAKGLGAPVVIMPLANWDIEMNSGSGGKVLWCHPSSAPFDKVPLVPVGYNKKMLLSDFSGDFLEERFSSYLDNLNLLYVAFTRARERLYVFVPRKKRGKELVTLLGNTLKTLAKPPDPGKEQDIAPVILQKDEDLYEAGQPSPPPGKKKSTGMDVGDYPAGTALGRLRIARKGREEFLLEKGGYKERIDKGTLYHTLLAEVITADDVQKAVEKVVKAGMAGGGGEKERLANEIRGFLRQPGVADWFSGRYQVKTETDIILPGGTVLRPDRVMTSGEEAVVVDYKFGEAVEEKYIAQVRRYMEALKKMSYKKVKGFVWYVMLNKIIEVNGGQ